MSPAPVALARRAQYPVVPNPNSIPGLVARYRASDLAALADAASVTSWTDLSGNGNTLGVLSNAPTKQTVSGRTCVRFASASSQSMSKNSPTNIPTTGPFTVLAVAQFASATNNVMVEYAGASNAGWAARINGGAYSISNYSNDTPTGIGPTTTAIDLHMWTLASNGTTSSGRRNNRKYATDGGSGGLFAGSRTRLTIGRADFFPTWALGADVYEVCVFNRLLTDQELDSLRPYFDNTYGLTILGTRYSASAHLTTSPTADGSGSCAEMSVLYFPSNWNSHKYWMTMVPLGTGNAANENPHVFYSDDNSTWTAVAGNPVVAAPASGTNADPHFFYNPNDSKVYLYWTVTGGTPTSGNGIWAKSSSDGSTWSAATQVLVSTDGTLNQEPTVRWDGTQYVLYTQNASTKTMSRRTSSSPTSGFSSATAVNITVPGSRLIWHIDVQYYAGRWYLAFSDDQVNRNCWLAVSTDGVNFICAKRPVLVPSLGFDSGGAVYRPSFLPPDDTTTNWRLWYTSGNVGNGNIWVAYTEFPVTEWPN